MNRNKKNSHSPSTKRLIVRSHAHILSMQWNCRKRANKANNVANLYYFCRLSSFSSGEGYSFCMDTLCMCVCVSFFWVYSAVNTNSAHFCFIALQILSKNLIFFWILFELKTFNVSCALTIISKMIQINAYFQLKSK